jgi:pyridoxal phosphate enzyme (YggS family)
MPEISHRLQQVCREISLYEQEFDRPAGSVQLLAVSKTRPYTDLLEAWENGQTCFAESYIQEALKKMSQLRKLAIQWHFIGPIQSNKTRAIAENFDWVHSIDRLKIAQRLNEQRPADKAPLQVLIQVNSSDEDSKSGCRFAELESLALSIATLPRLQLRGLMTIPAASDNFEQQRQPLRKLRHALLELNQSSFTLDSLSMGMSKDMRAAIAEGATIVRIGTALFGERKTASTD